MVPTPAAGSRSGGTFGSSLTTAPLTPFDATDVCCSDPIDLWDRLTTESGGMSARVKSHREARTGRLAGSPAGYLGMENCFYRVEIHESGPVGTATFTWSRDNGSHGDQAIPTSREFVELEEGVEVKFGDGSYQPGDYWIVRNPDRPDPAGEVEVLTRGIDHCYFRLALVTWGKAIKDCRQDCEGSD